jgi:hypothetical protein
MVPRIFALGRSWQSNNLLCVRSWHNEALALLVNDTQHLAAFAVGSGKGREMEACNTIQ